MPGQTQQKIIVSGVLRSPQGVLLARRPLTKKIAPGKYHLPGGHVEFGEDPEESLVREFEEEFSLHITVHAIVRSFSYVIGDAHTVGITFEVGAEHLPNPITFDPKETTEVVWVTLDTFKHYFSSDDHDYKTLEKYFAER